MPATNACGRFKANVNTRRRSVTGVTGSHKGRRRHAGRVDLSSTLPAYRRRPLLLPVTPVTDRRRMFTFALKRPEAFVAGIPQAYVNQALLEYVMS